MGKKEQTLKNSSSEIVVVQLSRYREISSIFFEKWYLKCTNKMAIVKWHGEKVEKLEKFRDSTWFKRRRNRKSFYNTLIGQTLTMSFLHFLHWIVKTKHLSFSLFKKGCPASSPPPPPTSTTCSTTRTTPPSTTTYSRKASSAWRTWSRAQCWRRGTCSPQNRYDIYKFWSWFFSKCIFWKVSGAMGKCLDKIKSGGWRVACFSMWSILKLVLLHNGEPVENLPHLRSLNCFSFLFLFLLKNTMEGWKDGSRISINGSLWKEVSSGSRLVRML